MATAGAHHAMTAGSTILLDVTQGIDGPSAITRLTPDALFPESEAPVSNGLGGAWSAPYGVSTAPQVLPDAVRWPGHCYKSPQPLSENYFLAAYSFDALIGEPKANPVNMFGLYLVDAFGNKELLYRDLNVCSLWPIPLAPRPRPPVVSGVAEAGTAREGSFFLQDVNQSWPQIPRGSVKSLRVVQVIPKSTWHANQPMLGLPSASPGKQVLGTVPVEPDGSAYFRAPAGLPLSFQALDEKGQAVQVMRSLTYLQPGETASCVGCHEPRTAAPAQRSSALALGRNPSTIRPAPDGANPLSFPILVQPVLDRNCVSCHNRQKPEGNVVLTGEPQGHYTASYNALATRVPYSDWAGKAGDFRVVNSEPMTRPGFFGARGSSVMKLILDGHHDVALTPDDLDRLTTWMDANALFYGTFDPADQARQQRGERIAGPKIQ
jgi:cytochrome c553